MKVFCHSCGKRTTHSVIAERKIGSVAGDDYHWGEKHYFVQCGGCEAFTYAVESWSEDDWNPQTGETESTWKTYPRSEVERQPMRDDSELPVNVRAMYREVIGAMNAHLPVLAGVGLRSLIEAICKDRGIIRGNLEKLIDGLAETGVLSQAQAEILHTHRFLGNAAAHEVISASPRELVAALDIAENVLRTIYVLPTLSAQVRTGRKPKK